MKPITKFILLMAVICLVTGPAWADVTISVPAEAIVHFAGQSQPALQDAFTPDAGWATQSMDTANPPNHYNFHNDNADWAGVTRVGSLPEADRIASSTIPPFVDVSGWAAAGDNLSIAATGLWRKGGAQSLYGPDGYIAGGNTIAHEEYDDFGISRVWSPKASLVGVFLGASAPSTPAPSILTAGTHDMTTPLLRQTFVIGSSLEGITIPTGATRLFFGFNNGFGWWNNDGDMEVTVVPAPGAVLLGAMGLGMVGWLKRRADKKAEA